jgi:hypothetical protein
MAGRHPVTWIEIAGAVFLVFAFGLLIALRFIP